MAYNNANVPCDVNQMAMSSSKLVRTKRNGLSAIATRATKRQKFDVNQREQQDSIIRNDFIHGLEPCLELLEDFDMNASVVGKAWNLVQNILELEKSESTVFSTIAQDDMVLLAERMIKAQHDFALLGIPIHVDIAYHYTRPENLQTIRTEGLMSKSERLAANINSRSNGSVYGDGIYCATHPTQFACRQYGEIGIMVARLKGETAATPARFDGSINTIVVRGRNGSHEFTVLEEARQCVPMFQFQPCMSLVHGRLKRRRYSQYQEELRNISAFQEKVQAVLDKHLNGGVATSPAVRWNLPRMPPPPKRRCALSLAPPPPPPPPGHGSHLGASKPPAQATPASWNRLGTVPAPTPLSQMVSPPPPAAAAANHGNNATSSPPVQATPAFWNHPGNLPTLRSQIVFPANHRTNVAASIQPAQATPPQQPAVSASTLHLQYQAPDSLSSCMPSLYHMRPLLTGTQLSQSCPICMDSYFRGKVVQLKTCGHCFHKACIDTALGHNPLCPTCRIPTSEPRGKMPSGTMTVEKGSRPCVGSECFGSIIIRYSIPSGIQKEYHPNPKKNHGSAYRTAYLPDTVEGNQLLKRLKYAFEHGLTFTVGTSLTTGVSNAVTWSSIHHKTNLRGGVHGFPDPSYFMNCNAELDNLHVPPADRL